MGRNGLRPTFDPWMRRAGFTFDPDQLREIFDRICDKRDWKDAVYAVVDRNEREVVRQAIEFMTATTPEFTEIANGKLAVYAVGYRDGPAGP